MNFITNRYYSILIGVLLIIVGLFIPNTIVGILICLILGAVVLYDEKVALLFLIITIPIRSFLIVFNSGFKFVGDILIFALLVKVLFDHRRNIRELFRFHYLELAFLAFLAVGAISALITGVALVPIIMQVRAFILFFLLFYIVRRMKLEERDIKDFAKVTFVTAVVVSLHGLVEKISVRTMLLPELWANMQLSPTNRTRVYGLTGGPNELALYLLIAFLISFYLVARISTKNKPYIYVGMTLIFTVFLLTYSRGAILVLISFLVVYFIANRKIHYFKQAAIIVITAAIAFFAIANLATYMDKHVIEHKKTEQTGGNKNGNKNNSTGIDRFTGALSQENLELSTADGRVFYVKKAIEVFKDRPIIGYGFGTFGGAATQTYGSPIYKQYGIGWNFYSDNQYIQILAETGVVGVAFIALFIFGLFTITWALRKGFFFSPMLIFFLVGGVTGSVVYNMLENDVFMLYYFIILGYAYQFINSNSKHASDQ